MSEPFTKLAKTLATCDHKWTTQPGTVTQSDPPDHEGTRVTVTRCEKCGTSIVEGLTWDD